MIYMLDTTACVAYLRQASPRLTARMRAHAGELAIAAIVAAELYYGAERSADPSANRAQVDAFLDPLPLAVFDRAAARAYGRVRADLAGSGRLIGPNDLCIAAIALATASTVVTHNVGEFSRVAGLLIEDWEA